MPDDRRFYVYIHRRKTDGSIFYVGKGSGKRALDRHNRSDWWKSIAARHGFDVEFALKGSPQECCFTYEKILIAAIGRDNLCNMTDGGEGGIDGIPAWNARSVYCSNGMKFDSAEHAARWLRNNGHPKACGAGVNYAINGNNHSAYGLTWSDTEGGCPEYIDPIHRTHLNQVRKVYCSNGMVFASSEDAASWVRENLGFKSCRSNITLACTGKYKTAFGLAWSYDGFDECKFLDVHAERVKKLSKPVLCVETGIVHYSIQNAARHLQKTHPRQISAAKISMACRGIRKRAYGYRWEYV